MYHYHVRCVRCGRVDDVEVPNLAGLEEEAARTSGYQICGHTLQFDGICPSARSLSIYGPRPPCKERKARLWEASPSRKESAMKWVCKVCGYIYEGSEPPAECPVCHAPASQFEEVKGELTLAAEHEYGIYDKTVKDNPNISDEDKATSSGS